MESDAQLRKDLDQFLSSFSVSRDIYTLSKQYLSSKINHLSGELGDFCTKIERCRAYNLLSFLSFLIGHEDNAFGYNEKSLKEYPGNIIGMCNRGWFLLKTDQKFMEIKTLCQNLVDAHKDTFKKMVAEAEIAYTYARLGVQFYRKASEKYLEVLAVAKRKRGDTKPSDELNDVICLWSFGCALAKSRLFSTYNVCNASDLEVDRNDYICVCQLSRDIIKMGEKSNPLIPRAYVLLGVVMENVERKKNLFPRQVKELLPEDPDLQLSTDDYFEKALKLQHNDIFVLERCGRHYKSRKNIPKSIELLEKANLVKPSSFNHHHLAKALKHDLVTTKVLSKYNMRASSQPLGELFCTGFNSKYYRTEQKSLLNCPKEILYIELSSHKEDVDKIIYHLEAANKLAMNDDAVYDKGLMYRHTGQIEAALEVFKSLMRNERCVLMLLANVYEQSAFCLQELMARDDGKNINNFGEDMKMYLKKSVEVSCSIVAKLPELKDCWESARTLKSFLLSEPSSAQNFIDLVSLKQKVNGSIDNIGDVLSALLDKIDSEGEKAEIYMEVIERYRHRGEFDNAALILGILTCRPAFYGHVEKKLYIEVNIESAIDVFKKGDKKCAELRLRNALDFCRRKCAVSKSEATKNDPGGFDRRTSELTFEVLILCDPDNEENGGKIQTVLENIRVKTTLNKRDSIHLDKLKSDVFTDIVEQSNHILIVYDFERTNKEKTKRRDRKLMRYFEIIKDIIDARGHGNFFTLISTKTEPSDVPELLVAHQNIVYNFEDEQSKMNENFDFIKQLLMGLAIGYRIE